MRRIGLLVALLIAPLLALAQVPVVPDLTGAVVRSVVNTETDGSLRFSYSVDNASGSLAIDSLEVSLATDSSRALVDIGGLDNTADRLSASLRHRTTLGTEGIVGAAFPSVPLSWTVGIDPAGVARWSALGEGSALPVGDFLGGFKVLSTALPGIRDARLVGEVLDFLPSEEDLDALDLTPADLREEIESSKQAVKLVAPVAPPAELDLVAFAAEVQSMREIAASEGWIATPGASALLADQIDAISTALAAGDNATGKGLAAGFIGRLDAISCTVLTCTGQTALNAEAYALMRFNMEYLLTNIPNSPPSCDAAEASPNLFWPPDHALIDVDVIHVVDPDGDPIVVSVQNVLSDEAVDSAGSGNTCPDAVIAPDGSLQLRAERTGRLDGRVYEIHYTAADPAGEFCAGMVKVCMPHEESEAATCEEGAMDFDAFVCP